MSEGEERYLTDSKWKMYKTVVLTTLLNSCKTWIVYEHYAKKAKQLLHELLDKAVENHVAKKVSDTEVFS